VVGLATRPPLAEQLVSTRYDALAAKIPACRPIVRQLRDSQGDEEPQALETALAEIAERAQHSLERRRQLVAFRFHLWQLIAEEVDRRCMAATAGQTHYMSLLNHLLDLQQSIGQRVLLATFNYDILLDSTVRDVITVWRLDGGFDSYIERPDFRLFKLHGSTTWARRFEANTAGMSGSLAHDFFIQRAYEQGDHLGDLVAHAPDERVGPNGEVDLPAMAVPVANKKTFECPDRHMWALKQDLPTGHSRVG